MKLYILTVCLSMLIFEQVLAQFQECASPTTMNLHDVNFIDDNIGVAVGDSGTIIRTTDGGLNWNIVMSNDTVSFKKVKFFNELNGISIGSAIYITENGGISWSKVDNSNYEFYDVEILNDSTCLLSGMPNRIIKSTNFGFDWETIVFDTSEFEIRFMSFLNENVGYASHWQGSVIQTTLKTLDGGVTWNLIDDASGQQITLIEDISFISEEIGFRGGWYSAHLMKTHNSSEYWEDVNFTDNTSTSGFGIYDFHIEKSMPNAYFACGWYGDIFKSTDGGNNWFELNDQIGNIILYGIYFIDDNNGWVVGQQGKIFKTDNGGEIVGLNTKLNNLNISVFPNPTSNFINIRNPDILDIRLIQIFDNNGRLIKSISQPAIKIDFSDIPVGIYLIKILTYKGVYSQKINKI